MRQSLESGELSDDELEQVAGGMNTNQPGAILNSVMTVGLGCAIVSIGSAAVENDTCRNEMGL